MSEEKPVYNANFEIETEHLNKTIGKFKEVAYSQELKGIEKYGKPLDPLDDYDWLQMALEESVDETKYLIAEMEKRKFAINKIRNITGHVEINFWLDFMEGKS